MTEPTPYLGIDRSTLSSNSEDSAQSDHRRNRHGNRDGAAGTNRVGSYSRLVTTSLVEYVVPVNADVRDVHVMFVGEHDAMTPLGTKRGRRARHHRNGGRDRQSGLSREGHAGPLVADLHRKVLGHKSVSTRRPPLVAFSAPHSTRSAAIRIETEHPLVHLLGGLRLLSSRSILSNATIHSSRVSSRLCEVWMRAVADRRFTASRTP